MATGQKAFAGESQASLISAIMSGDPVPISTLQQMTPARLDEIVKTCLAKDPDDRWQSAGDVGRLVLGVVEGGSQVNVAASVAVVPRRASWRQAAPWMLTALAAGAVVASVAFWGLTRPGPPPVSRLVISPAPSEPLQMSVNTSDVAISPDGRQIAYIAGGESEHRLQIRQLDELTATTVATGEVLLSPFFSPDGRWIGFSDFDEGIKKVSTAGGPVVPVAPFLAAGAGSVATRASWGPDDSIIVGVFGSVAATRGVVAHSGQRW